jgi:hypothetical protein
MEDEVISLAGNIFMVKGNDVEVFSSMGLSKFDPSKELIEGATPHRIKELLDKGYELAVDDGAEKGQAFKKAINNANIMPGSSFMNFSGGTGNKLLKNIKSIGSGLGKVLPSIAGFSTPIGAIASGLLYAGTAKQAGANTALEPYEGVYATRNILDTPITPANRNLYNQAGVDTSLGPMDRDSGFDRYMQNKIQNQRNNQGIMGARTKPQAPPGQPVTGRHIGYNAGGIASLRR